MSWLLVLPGHHQLFTRADFTDNGWVQDCSVSIADALKILQSCTKPSICSITLRWRHNERDSVSNHQPHDCLLNRLFRRRSKKTSKLRVTGLCVGNSPGTGEFPAQMASYAENVSIWWRHHEWDYYSGTLSNVLQYKSPEDRVPVNGINYNPIPKAPFTNMV